MSTEWGTNCFTSMHVAERYYCSQGYGREAVQAKVSNGEIVIGPPQGLKPGDKLVIREGRYHIRECD